MVSKYEITINDNPDTFSILGHQTQFFKTMHNKGLRIEAAQHYLIEAKDHDKSVLGGAHFLIQRDILYIEVFWIDPEVQKKGIGSEIFTAIKKFGKEHDVSSIVGTTRRSDNNLNFWLHEGSQIIGSIKLKNDEMYFIHVVID